MLAGRPGDRSGGIETRAGALLCFNRIDVGGSGEVGQVPEGGDLYAAGKGWTGESGYFVDGPVMWSNPFLKWEDSKRLLHWH